jgi:predicted amidohydrolase YtcJ
LPLGYAWRSLLDTGAVIAAGSDAPVEKGDPRIEFYAGIHRHDLKGDAGADWYLEQRMTRGEALRALSAHAAFAARDEARRGTLAPGMAADLSIFSDDLMTIAPAAILAARPVATMVAGRLSAVQPGA